MKKILFVLLFCFTSQAQVLSSPVNCGRLFDRVNYIDNRYFEVLHTYSRKHVRTLLEDLERLSSIYKNLCQDHQEADTQEADTREPDTQ